MQLLSNEDQGEQYHCAKSQGIKLCLFHAGGHHGGNVLGTFAKL